MSSGIAVSNECLEEFQKLKLGKKAKYIIYKINAESTEIGVDKVSSEASYDTFLEDLPDTEPRYAVYDFEYKKDDGTRNKLCFYAWTPDNAKIKQKMVYASSKDALRKSLVGIASEIQGTDLSEVAYETGKFIAPSIGREFTMRSARTRDSRNKLDETAMNDRLCTAWPHESRYFSES